MLTLHLHDTEVRIQQLAPNRLVIGGWTGRDSARVAFHIAELKELGVAPPSRNLNRGFGTSHQRRSRICPAAVPRQGLGRHRLRPYRPPPRDLWRSPIQADLRQADRCRLLAL